MRKLIVSLLPAFTIVGIANAQDLFHDDYTSSSQLNYYQVDRSPAQVFETTTFNGGPVAHLKVWDNVSQSQYHDPFYDFQGYERTLDTAHTQGFGLGPGSYLTADLYVPTEWNGAVKRGGDLWARIHDTTSGNPGLDPYPTIGVYNYNDGQGARLSIYTPYDGGIHDYNAAALAGLGASLNLDSWNNLRMFYKGTSGVDFLLNGVKIFTDSDPGYVNTVTLENAFYEGWRPQSMLNTGTSYDIYYANLRAGPVPEPASLTVLGLGAVGFLRRRRRARETARVEKALKRTMLMG